MAVLLGRPLSGADASLPSLPSTTANSRLWDRLSSKVAMGKPRSSLTAYPLYAMSWQPREHHARDPPRQSASKTPGISLHSAAAPQAEMNPWAPAAAAQGQDRLEPLRHQTRPRWVCAMHVESSPCCGMRFGSAPCTCMAQCSTRRGAAWRMHGTLSIPLTTISELGQSGPILYYEHIAVNKAYCDRQNVWKERILMNFGMN